MANFFQGTYFDKPFFSNPFFHGDYFKQPFFTGIGGGTPGTGNPVVPTVISSEINPKNAKRIIVTFDQEMRKKGDLRQKIFIVIDGGAPLIPSSISFSHDYMSLVFATGFTKGTVVSWKYDDSDPAIILESKSGVKADNQTYAVTNGLV